MQGYFRCMPFFIATIIGLVIAACIVIATPAPVRTPLGYHAQQSDTRVR